MKSGPYPGGGAIAPPPQLEIFLNFRGIFTLFPDVAPLITNFESYTSVRREILFKTPNFRSRLRREPPKSLKFSARGRPERQNQSVTKGGPQGKLKFFQIPQIL